MAGMMAHYAKALAEARKKLEQAKENREKNPREGIAPDGWLSLINREVQLETSKGFSGKVILVGLIEAGSSGNFLINLQFDCTHGIDSRTSSEGIRVRNNNKDLDIFWAEIVLFSPVQP